MKIGYPCINLTLPCSSGRTFRLKSYSEERLLATVESNLVCLGEILRFNRDHGILFFRITSDLVPFASHPVCRADWQDELKDRFAAVGSYIRKTGMRISMHPDQFILINARDPAIVTRSIAELTYHAEVLDLLGLDASAKIQLHVGGVYGDRDASIARFIEQYRALDERILRRLVIENDDRRFSLGDCMDIHRECGVPVLFDVLHHRVFPSATDFTDAAATWGGVHGIPMVDYSTQEAGARPGRHARTIDPADFAAFVAATHPLDTDIMLEIKDKEISAIKALSVLSGDERLVTG